ncbi:hypothetical protein [Streptomyces sp. NPDC096033]|uniref:hypothetical protein n=1 Tax=Streptomyces sp. NPDC096033 TaxID=3366071 RepID=UPI0037F7F221
MAELSAHYAEPGAPGFGVQAFVDSADGAGAPGERVCAGFHPGGAESVGDTEN